MLHSSWSMWCSEACMIMKDEKDHVYNTTQTAYACSMNSLLLSLSLSPSLPLSLSPSLPPPPPSLKCQIFVREEEQVCVCMSMKGEGGSYCVWVCPPFRRILLPGQFNFSILLNCPIQYWMSTRQVTVAEHYNATPDPYHMHQLLISEVDLHTVELSTVEPLYEDTPEMRISPLIRTLRMVPAT